MLNLNDLRMFARVVETGGFTAASRLLNVPKQTLSKRIAELERATGVRLLQRTSRSFTVTDIGREVYAHASAIVIEAESAQAAIAGRLAEPTGLVRITASVPTAQHLLAELLPQIARDHPRLKIALEATDRFVDIVGEGYDIALRDHISPLPDSDLVQRSLGIEEFWLIASPLYLESAPGLDHPDDLRLHKGLDFGSGETRLTLHHRDGRRIECQLEPGFYSNESSTLVAAARQGLGVVRLPRSICSPSIHAGELVRVLSDWTAGSVQTTMLMPHRRGQLPSVRTVADRIASHLGKLLVPAQPPPSEQFVGPKHSP